jgi:undecaprenyl-diphosphatase
MTIFQALVLGIIQGFTEFLPISSSAHLALAPWLFGWPDQGLAFDVALHLGTLIAVLWFFSSQWVTLARAAAGIIRTRQVQSDEERRVVFLILATIPGAIAGFLLQDYAEQVFRDPRIMVVTLALMGLLLWGVDTAASQARSLGAMRWIDALAIGTAQVLALVPGVSRSGSTITAGRALGFTREGAAVFSFLMSMPITAAAAVLKVPDVLRTTGVDAPFVVGVIASAASGWLAISVLLKYVSRHSYGVFAVYRVLLAIFILGILVTRG